MSKSKISWTERVWNPVRGCSKVSEGCKNCYAERQAARFCGEGQPYHGLIKPSRVTISTDEHRDMDGNYTGQDDYEVKVPAHWTGEARFIPEMLEAPLRRKEPSLVFVNSMSDLFHKDISDEQIAEVFGVIAVAAKTFIGPRVKGRLTRDFGPHVFQILTKRADRLCLLSTSRFREMVARAAYRHAMDRVDAGWLNQCISGRREYGNHCTLDPMWPLPNLHLGVSVEHQRAADERIPLLLKCPAAVRWVSAEPLLGPVDLTDISAKTPTGTEQWDALAREYDDDIGDDGPRIDWVVVGGESGTSARPIHPEWARSIRDQCKAANVPYWFKQWGEWLPISQQSEEFTDALYKSNRTAETYEDQGSLDELYGRKCTVAKTVIHEDGSGHKLLSPLAFQQGTNAMTTFLVGKKRAGNLLDGVRYEMRPGDKWK